MSEKVTPDGLRRLAIHVGPYTATADALRAAADEIEKLRSAAQKILDEDAAGPSGPCQRKTYYTETLGEKPFEKISPAGRMISGEAILGLREALGAHDA